MTKLRQLYHSRGQSPWLDNLTCPYLRDGRLAGLVRDAREATITGFEDHDDVAPTIDVDGDVR